jgi:formate hydrogenlyase subunit 3/multisubunit Na+/H+ antiporter MnhD subunit
MPHLIAAPILLPMATAALMLLLGDARRPLKAWISVLSCALGLAASVGLLLWVQHGDGRTRWASTCPATGRRPTASCWWWTACRP